MNVKLNPATPKTVAVEEQVKVADDQATIDAQANAEQAPEQATETTQSDQEEIQDPVQERLPVDVGDLEPFHGRERCPSDWDIREEDGELVFTNHVTQRRIVGITVEQFSALMKG